MLQGFADNRHGLKAGMVMAVIYSRLCQSDSTAPIENLEMETVVRKNGWRLRICALAVILAALIPLGSANAQRDWAATLYTGRAHR